MKNPDIYRAELMRGMYTRVARNLRLSKNGRSHVARVASGERKSPRVEAALKKELQRISRLIEKRSAALGDRRDLERAA